MKRKKLKKIKKMCKKTVCNKCLFGPVACGAMNLNQNQKDTVPCLWKLKKKKEDLKNICPVCEKKVNDNNNPIWFWNKNSKEKDARKVHPECFF